MMFCKMTPLVITEGHMVNFTGGKMEAIYQADDQVFFGSSESRLRVACREEQSIITSVFHALMGTR